MMASEACDKGSCMFLAGYIGPTTVFVSSLVQGFGFHVNFCFDWSL